MSLLHPSIGDEKTAKYELFDSHNHIQDMRLFSRLDQVMKRASAEGVTRMALKGCCEKDWSVVLEVINRYPNHYFSFGLHPWFVSERSGQWFQGLEGLLTSYPQAGVGEIGIDHAIAERNDEEQEAVFLQQLELARKMERPVSIHCRKAWGRLIELLDQSGALPRGMLIHCFGGSAEVALELVKRGAYISFSGTITRPNSSKAARAIQEIPFDRVLLETDAPDLLPKTVCGPDVLMDKGVVLNEPSYLPHVLRAAAEMRGVSEEELAKQTVENTLRFFG